MYKFFDSSVGSTNFNLLLNNLLSANSSFKIPELSGKSIALYGAGNLGRMAYEYCRYVGIKVDFIVDVNANNLRLDRFWSNINMFTPDQVEPKFRKSSIIAICNVSHSYHAISSSLENMGWSSIFPFYDIANQYLNRHPLNNGWVINLLSDNDKTEIFNIFKLLDDDISKAHYLQFLAWRYLRQEWIFKEAPINVQNRFFIPEVLDVLDESCRFIDIGAHQGEVLGKFIKLTNGRFDKIFAIEPDPDNLKILKNNIDRYDVSIKNRISVINSVLSNKIGEVKFLSGLGYSSQCTELSQNKVIAVTLDSLEIESTLVKIHVEGFELNVLGGAIKHINKYRPILMVTGYHNADGIWKIFKWMRDSLNGYKIVIRLHGYCGTGFVIYAFPR